MKHKSLANQPMLTPTSYDPQGSPEAMKYEVEGIGFFYFSYDQIVAFKIRDGKLWVRLSNRGPDTPRHLDLIDGGNQIRLDSMEFDEMLDVEMSRHAGNPNKGN